MKTSTREDVILFLIGASFVVVMPITMSQGHNQFEKSISERAELRGSEQPMDVGKRDSQSGVQHLGGLAAAGATIERMDTVAIDCNDRVHRNGDGAALDCPAVNQVP